MRFPAGHLWGLRGIRKHERLHIPPPDKSTQGRKNKGRKNKGRERNLFRGLCQIGGELVLYNMRSTFVSGIIYKLTLAAI